MEDSAIVPDTRLRNEAGHASDMDSSPPAYEDASTALFSAKAKRSVKFIVSLNGSLTGPRDFVYYGTDLDAHVPALATNSIRILCEESDDTPPGKDILTYPGNHQQIASVSGLHASIIEDRSPLLAAAFESSSSGQRLHLETLCSHTVMPFLRYLYTGSYSTTGEWEDVPTSVLLHCRMYHLGDLYDLLDLKSQAYVNVLRQCEYGCSSPEKPIDLCEAIEFAYKTLPGHDTISDAIVQYCVTRCLSHKLHEDADFRDLAFNVRAFHQDLTRVCRDRGYEDESSAIIIQLPYKHYAPDTYASTENPPISGFTDIIHHFHSSDRFDDDTLSKKRRQVTLGGEIASPKDQVRMHGLSNQTANVSPVTAPVETMPNIDKIELPIRESNISQIKQMLTAESLFGDHPSTSHQNFDWFPKLSTALPGPGFFGEDKAIEGQGHKYPLNVYDGENREDGLKRRSNEIAGLAHDVESGKSQPILLPFREKHSRHSQLPFWQDRARHDAVDVTASRNAPSNGPMKCEPDSVTLAIESQVKRQKIESQPQKAYGPNHPWWRPQFAQPPSHYSQPMFQLSPTDAGRGEVSDHTSCMFIVGSQESDIPTVPRFTLSNGSPNPGAELSDVTPRTTRPSPTDFALAESVDRVKLPVASDLDRPRKLPTHFKTVSAPGHVPGSSLQPVVNSDRFDPEPSRARVTDMYRRGVVRQDLRRIQQSPAIKQVQPQDNIDHLNAGFPDVKRLDRQPVELRMHRERLADQGNNHACKLSCTQEPTKFAQTQAHGNESTVKPKSTADDHSDATPPIATKNVPAHVRNHALQDYQMQLMLLEQQNKKRAHMCRQDSDDFALVRPQQRVAPRQTRLPGSNSPIRAAEMSCDVKAAPVTAINNDFKSPTSDLPSTGPQNDPAVAVAENSDPTSNATDDLTKRCSDSEDVDMCDSDSDSDLSWVDVPLAAVDSAQQQAGPSKSPSTSGPIGARRPSSPSDSDWDFV